MMQRHQHTHVSRPGHLQALRLNESAAGGMTNSSLVGIASMSRLRQLSIHGVQYATVDGLAATLAQLPLLQVNYYTHTYLLDISVCTCKETRICDTADSMVPEALTCQAVECLANWLAVQPVMAANSSDDVLSCSLFHCGAAGFGRHVCGSRGGSGECNALSRRLRVLLGAACLQKAADPDFCILSGAPLHYPQTAKSVGSSCP
jgi:hypothetical protein